MRHLVAIATVLVGSSIWALEADEHTLFLCHFDGTAEASFSVGSPHAEGVAGFTEGRHGQALSAPLGLLPFAQSVAPLTTGVQYPTAGNINLQQGTIELWVRVYGDILTTTDKSPKLRYLVSSGKYTGGNHGCALVLSHFDGQPGQPYMLLWTRQNGSDKTKTWSVSCRPNWKPGEWHHVAATYSPAEDRLFVDGKQVGRTATGAGMDLIGDNFALGASIYHSGVADCAIDEVRISDNVRYASDFAPD
ncbi:LamG domain-containing protein [bacterium]|nr:LamG domain-containing protein [bacterium]